MELSTFTRLMIGFEEVATDGSVVDHFNCFTGRLNPVDWGGDSTLGNTFH